MSSRIVKQINVLILWLMIPVSTLVIVYMIVFSIPSIEFVLTGDVQFTDFIIAHFNLVFPAIFLIVSVSVAVIMRILLRVQRVRAYIDEAFPSLLKKRIVR